MEDGEQPGVSRRQIINSGLAAIGVSAMAGCTGIGGQGGGGTNLDGNNSTGQSATQSPTPATGVIKEATISGTELVVTLTDSADADRVNVVGPDGSQPLSTSVGTGQTQVTFQIASKREGRELSAGVNEVLAVSGDEVLGKSTIEVRDEVTIPRLTLKKTNVFDKEVVADYEFDVKNGGNAPIVVNYATVSGPFRNPDPPSEIDRLGLNRGKVSVVSDDSSFTSEVLLLPDETVTLETVYQPFLKGNETEGLCASNELSATIFVRTVSSASLTREIDVTLEGELVEGGRNVNPKYFCTEATIDDAR